MSKWFKIFGTCLLGLVALMGAVGILYPLVFPATIEKKPVTAPTQVTPEVVPEEPAQEEKEEVLKPTVEPLPIPETADPAVMEILAGMTLEEKLYQLFWVTPEEITGVGVVAAAGNTTKNALEQYPVGGIAYFAQNLQSEDQILTMLRNTQSYSEIPLLMGVDEEGGRVSRLGSNENLGTTKWDAMATYSDKDEVYEMGKTMGRELGALGFNVNFAPVADLADEDNVAIGDRSFSKDAQTAATLVSTLVKGMKIGGISPVLKHFPGLGNTETDPHEGETLCPSTLEELESNEFLPFYAGVEAGAPIVMVGHQVMTGFAGEDKPSTMSELVIGDLLRGTIGFQGVVITDAMNMGAITDKYPAGEASVKAIFAGCDMILLPESLEDSIAALQKALQDGILTEERIDQSVYRILNLKMEKGLFED